MLSTIPNKWYRRKGKIMARILTTRIQIAGNEAIQERGSYDRSFSCQGAGMQVKVALYERYSRREGDDLL